MKKTVVYVVLLGLWFVLVWPFCPRDGGVKWQDVAAGVAVAALTVLVMRDVTAAGDAPILLNPARLFWMAAYGVVLGCSIIKANIDVAYRVLHPAMPIRPGIVKVRTTLKSRAALTALSNSITLTPGTLTVSVTPDGVLYVHWINVRTVDVEEATRHVVSRFEWFLRRIYE